jgi:hypothetical protein
MARLVEQTGRATRTVGARDRAVTKTKSDQTATRSADTSTGTSTGTHQVSDANASSPHRKADGADDEDACESIYARFPRKEGRGAAIAAIRKAIGRLKEGEGAQPMTWQEAIAFLIDRTESFANSPAGKRPDRSKIPHPSTWFNQQRYLDDSEAWQHISETWESRSPSIARAERNRSAWERAFAKRDRSRALPHPAKFRLTSDADLEAQERRDYATWSSMNETYKAQNPWMGRAFA